MSDVYGPPKHKHFLKPHPPSQGERRKQGPGGKKQPRDMADDWFLVLMEENSTEGHTPTYTYGHACSDT